MLFSNLVHLPLKKNVFAVGVSKISFVIDKAYSLKHNTLHVGEYTGSSQVLFSNYRKYSYMKHSKTKTKMVCLFFLPLPAALALDILFPQSKRFNDAVCP
jgi:hypothetical protein